MLFFWRGKKYRELALEIALLARYLADNCLVLESRMNCQGRWLRDLLEKDAAFIENRKNWSEDDNTLFDSTMAGEYKDYGTLGVPAFDYNIEESIDTSLERIEAIIEALNGKR